MDNFKIDKIFPISHNVVFFHAHCDDESFLSAGLLNKLTKKNRKCTVVYGAATVVEGEEKTIIRQQQTTRACSTLGVNSVIFLKYCEPKYQGIPLINQRVEDIGSELIKILRKNDIKLPISLVCYDKNGGYGNKDHKVIHFVGRYIKNRYPDSILLSEVTLNRDKISRWIKNVETRLKPELLPQLEYWVEEFGLAENEIQFSYELDDNQLKLKREALAMHTFYNKPNLFPLALGKIDFKKVFGTEYLHFPHNIEVEKA